MEGNKPNESLMISFFFFDKEGNDLFLELLVHFFFTNLEVLAKQIENRHSYKLQYLKIRRSSQFKGSIRIMMTSAKSVM